MVATVSRGSRITRIQAQRSRVEWLFEHTLELGLLLHADWRQIPGETKTTFRSQAELLAHLGLPEKKIAVVTSVDALKMVASLPVRPSGARNCGPVL